ncbi:response regulator transcription factor [Candidatus Gracilibacteria bacterium]|nr:response regulator transcription factor [Candidatus Gracilibacteria bacterium]
MSEDSEGTGLLEEIKLLKRDGKVFEASHISKIELERLQLLSEGLMLKEIAYKQGVSEGAIKQSIVSARKKLKAKTSAETVVIFTRYKIYKALGVYIQ